MGQAFDRDGNVLGEAFGDSKREVFDKLNEEFKHAHEIRVKALEDKVAAAERAELPPPTEHTLTLEFGRFLSESEFREVVERAKQVPYVQRLRADAVAAFKPESPF